MGSVPEWRKRGVIPIWEQGANTAGSGGEPGNGPPSEPGPDEPGLPSPLESTPALNYLRERKVLLYGLESYVLRLFVPSPGWAQNLRIGELRKLSKANTEVWACRQYAANGWIAVLTVGSGDAGLDLLAIKGSRRLGVQVKGLREEGKSSSPEIIATLGGGCLWRCNELHFISTGDFTKPGREVAWKAPIPTRLSNFRQIEENNIWG